MSSLETERPTILVVDDQPTNIRLLFEALRHTGYRTLAARSGEGAIEQAEVARPDLILLDVMMPGLDGFETCRRLRQSEATRRIPIIFMTALTDAADKVRGFEAGAVDYVTKPLEHQEVLARVNTHLAIRKLQASQDLFLDFLLRVVAQRTLEGIWGETSDFLQSRQEISQGCVWFLEEPEADSEAKRLHLVYSTGKTRTSPREWAHGAGTYALVPLEEPLMGTAAREGRQRSGVDGADWERPEWAQREGIEAYIATPLVWDGAVIGVFATFYDRSIREEQQDRKRWHRIATAYITASLANAHAFEQIESLRRHLELENEYLREEVKDAKAFGDIVGASKALRRTLEQVELVAKTAANVLILGESGTGKELIARAIHERSSRAKGPLIKVNCAAVPKELFESEFFGHVKGAFTGAVRDRTGRFELAHEGTLFLDEVGEIPLELQGKLLRVLQEGSFERIGEERTRTSDVRIIAATNRNLSEEVESGRFRQDLYFRLSVFPLRVPPLRERREDIPLLARHFVAVSSPKLGLPEVPLSAAHARALASQEWRGNVRELQNAIERAMILGRGRDLVFDFDGGVAGGGGLEEPSLAEARVLTEPELEEIQRRNIRLALDQADWRIQGEGGAAERLEIKPTTLRSRMAALGIEKPR